MKILWSRKLIASTILLLAIGSIGIYSALAQVIGQPPSAFDIATDGVFTTPEEWSDVQPVARLFPDLGVESLVYTAVDPGLEALYLMYDLPGSTIPFPFGNTVGPVHFHNGGHLFQVFLNVGGPPPGITVFKDGVQLDLFMGNLEPSMEGAVGFGTSPSSNVPHNMFELEVLFDGSDPTLAGHTHGQYSPEPSHWGASIQQTTGDPQPDEIPPFDCANRQDPNNNIQVGASLSIGDELGVSSACVEVVEGTGGFTLVDPLPIPGAVPVLEIDIKPGSDPNSINPRSRGTIPVAILSTSDFDATTEVDKASLTFGRTGNEDSLARCTKSDEDANGDGVLDVVCHFNTQDAGFVEGDQVGILRGETVDGTPIVGFDSVRVVPTGNR